MKPRRVEAAIDRIDVALEVGRRLRHFRTLTEHPLFAQIYGRLIGGQSTYRIATWLHSAVPYDDPLGASSATVEALARRLRRFRAALPDGVVLSAGYLDRRFRSLDAEIDVLAELDALIRYQKQRIEILAEREHEFQVPIDAQRREVRQLADLLTTRHLIAVRLGINPTAHVQLSVDVPKPPALQAERNLGDLLHEFPILIPDVMALFDRIDAVTGQSSVSAGLRSGPPVD